MQVEDQGDHCNDETMVGGHDEIPMQDPSDSARRQRWLRYASRRANPLVERVEGDEIDSVVIDQGRSTRQSDRQTSRRTRQTEQQRARRAEQQRSRRASRLEQQRARRRHIQDTETSVERVARVAAETQRRGERRQREDDDTRMDRQTRRRQTDQARRDARRRENTAATEALADEVLKLRGLSDEQIHWLSEGQRFTQDPRLALAYYHCCGVNPESQVLGNEAIVEDDSVRQRMGCLLEDYPKASDLAACQDANATTASENTEIWACASCGRILLVNAKDRVFLRRLSDISESFLLSQTECGELVEGVSVDFVRQFRQVYFDGDNIYHLIPELVKDRNKIPLCQKCNAGPRTNKFSLASGHDYGRIAQLPLLSDVALACRSPLRCFGLELSLSSSSGHAIAFASNGPCELARVLPSLDRECLPRVTFIGPMEEWRTQQKKFRNLYEIDVDAVYKWLEVLTATNSVFIEEQITVDNSIERRRQLNQMEEFLISTVHVSQSAPVAAVFAEATSEQDDESEGSEESSHIVVHNSVVMPPVQGCRSGSVHQVVDALTDVVGGNAEDDNCDDRDSCDGDGSEAGQHEEHNANSPVVVVKRSRTPIVEWFDNSKILAGVFPHLFLTGSKMLPSGSLPRDYVDHFMHYWDGRFEKCATFTAMLFNQLQRHSAVHKAARVGMTHGRAMTRFGKLASTKAFKQALQFAKDNPESPDAVRMNASLLRLLSLVGVCVPFSPFERAATRPKLGAMRYRYGVAQNFVTIAPPEHDDLLLHRLAGLRDICEWNNPDHAYSKRDCCFEDFPNLIRESADARQVIAKRHPALSAQVFERTMKSLTRDVIRCQDSGASRVSRNYLEYKSGVYGRIAAFNAVIEPQASGRLHVHLTLYGSSVNPDVLSRVAACEDLWPHARRWFAAVSTTQISSDTKLWCEEWKETHGRKNPRSFHIKVPPVSSDYYGFHAAAERRAYATNQHSHSHTCHKGIRGRFMCRLARPAGVHTDETKPLHIRLVKTSDIRKRRRAEFAVKPVNGDLAASIDKRQLYCDKRVVPCHTEGAVVWEQTRMEDDAMFVETNLPLACLTGAHTNSAIINGKDAGDMVEEYQQSYITKEKGGLKCGATVMLTALNDITAYPSVADDQGTSARHAKHLATRTVNAFTGGTEWPHALMIYALLGYRSFLSSDVFWYVFPHKLADSVSHTDVNASNTSVDDESDGDGDKLPLDDIDGDAASSETDDETEPVGFETNDAENDDANEDDQCDVNQTLDAIVDNANDDNVAQQIRGTTYSSTGARMFKVGDQIVLVTQAESYRHRGHWFEDYTALELEAIVDVLPRRDDDAPEEIRRGRPKRRAFDLGADHPLYPHFQGFIRTKFKTIMLGGPPPPRVPKTGVPSVALSKYVLSLLYPWCLATDSLPFSPTPRNLVRVCREWNSTEATFIDRQRYRVMANLFQKHYRSSRNEKTCSEWRNRNADMWQQSSLRATEDGTDCTAGTVVIDDPEASGTFSIEDRELYELTKAASAKDKNCVDAVRAIRATFWALIPPFESSSTLDTPLRSAIT